MKLEDIGKLIKKAEGGDRPEGVPGVDYEWHEPFSEFSQDSPQSDDVQDPETQALIDQLTAEGLGVDSIAPGTGHLDPQEGVQNFERGDMAGALGAPVPGASPEGTGMFGQEHSSGFWRGDNPWAWGAGGVGGLAGLWALSKLFGGKDEEEKKRRRRR